MFVLNVIDGCIHSDMAVATREQVEEEPRLLLRGNDARSAGPASNATDAPLPLLSGSECQWRAPQALGLDDRDLAVSRRAFRDLSAGAGRAQTNRSHAAPDHVTVPKVDRVSKGRRTDERPEHGTRVVQACHCSQIWAREIVGDDCRPHSRRPEAPVASTRKPELTGIRVRRRALQKTPIRSWRAPGACLRRRVHGATDPHPVRHRARLPTRFRSCTAGRGRQEGDRCSLPHS